MFVNVDNIVNPPTLILDKSHIIIPAGIATDIALAKTNKVRN